MKRWPIILNCIRIKIHNNEKIDEEYKNGKKWTGIRRKERRRISDWLCLVMSLGDLFKSAHLTFFCIFILATEGIKVNAPKSLDFGISPPDMMDVNHIFVFNCFTDFYVWSLLYSFFIVCFLLGDFIYCIIKFFYILYGILGFVYLFIFFC